MSNDFSPEQKRYLEGFVAGASAAKTAIQRPAATPVAPAPSGPDAAHLAAMARFEQAGSKLNDQEKWKREEHPFDAYQRLKEQSLKGEYPKPNDNFRWRYHGLFYVAPAQDSYMCRLRIPNGILTSWQLERIAELAQKHGGGYAHVTTRANLQIREITAEHAVPLIEGLADIGLAPKGAGADNIRNVTGSPTAGICADELHDTRADAKAWNRHILEDRSLTGLPRKFNVAFDGGGRLAVLEETNDIAFTAVRVLEGQSVAAGVAYRLGLGGITGHRDLARDTGVVIPTNDAIAVADAIVRVFIDTGDRTDRKKARLKYVLDTLGIDAFLKRVEDKLGRSLPRVPQSGLAPRGPIDRLGHIGAHAQRQPGLSYLGIVLSVGKMTSAQMKGLADIARRHGDGDLRLTVWQNLLVSGIADAEIETVEGAVRALGFETNATTLRAGLVACTGSAGCKFAAADTKATAEEIATYVDQRLSLDQPVNVHITGCHHSCAQHYIGDIGLIGARVAINDDGDSVDGYDIVVGGGYGPDAAIGREIAKGIPRTETPEAVRRLLAAWIEGRSSATESFQAFTGRQSSEALRAFATMAGDP